MSSTTAAVRTVIVCRPPLEQDVRYEKQGFLSVSNDSQGIPVLEIPGSTATAAKDKRATKISGDRLFGNGARPLDQLCLTEVEPLLQGVFAGEDAAIIAFGQTSSGKSFTMGTEAVDSDTGSTTLRYPYSVSTYSARRLFELAKEKQSQDLSVFISMCEVYREGGNKEQMFNLLQGFSRPKVTSLADTSPIWQPVAGGAEDLLDKIHEGAILRNTDRTDGNLRSSRSHAVITIRVQHRQQTADGRLQLVTGRLMLVDLAGSERAASAADGSVTQKQGAGINVGLLFLGKVIEEVAQTGSSLNFRNSELTRLLKPALSGGQGGCRTLMIGCISPCLAHLERTKDTIHYMEKAGKICNVVSKKVESLDSKRVQALQAEKDAWKERCTALANQVLSLEQELQDVKGRGIDTTGDTVNQVSKGGETVPPSTMSSTPSSALKQQSSQQHDVVVLSVEEHKALLQELESSRNTADSLEVLLKHADKRNEQLAAQLITATTTPQAVDEIAEALPELQHEGFHTSTTTPMSSTRTPSGSLRLSLHGQQQQQQHTPLTPTTTVQLTTPRLASAASVSPLLTAARETSTELDAYVSSHNGLLFSVDDMCLSESSNLPTEALDVLLTIAQKKVDAFMKSGARQSNDVSGLSRELQEASREELLQALRYRGLELSIFQLALRSYNEYLGKVEEDLSVAEEKVAEVKVLEAQLHQAAQEKVNYVRMTAAYAEALDITQAQLKEFDASKQSPPTSDRHLNSSGTPGGFFARFRPSSGHHRTPTTTSPASPSPSLSASPNKPPLPLSPPYHSNASQVPQQPTPTHTTPIMGGVAAFGAALLRGATNTFSFGSPPSTSDNEIHPTPISSGQTPDNGASSDYIAQSPGAVSPELSFGDVVSEYNDANDTEPTRASSGLSERLQGQLQLQTRNSNSGGDISAFPLTDIAFDDGDTTTDDDDEEEEEEDIVVFQGITTETQQQQQQEEEEPPEKKEMRQYMQGPINTAAISNTRKIGQDFAARNPHWQPPSSLNSTSTSVTNNNSNSEAFGGFGLGKSLKSLRRNKSKKK